MHPDWRQRYDTAILVTQQAGRLALRYFDTGLNVEWKADQSPVTVADREAETLLRSALLKAFPEDGFLGEEHGEHAGTSGYRWIIDPIDGTRNFIRAIPVWGTLVGLEFKGEMIAGVVMAPALGQTWHALRGDGCYRDGRRIRVTDISQLDQAAMFYTSITWFQKAGREAQFKALAARTQLQRGMSDFYGHVLVAQGSGEFMAEYGVNSWDVAALKPIIEEAGGRFSNWDGGSDINRPDVLLSNGKMHDEILRLLGGPL